MKCPKCGYLGFDSGERCKNCGYDFSLSDTSGVPASRQTPSMQAFGESPLRDPHVARGARYRHASSAVEAVGVDRPLAGNPEGTPVDLPLFGDEMSGPVLPPPRAPLAVRRATPTPSRSRPRPSPPQPEALSLNLGDPATEVSGEAGPADGDGARTDGAAQERASEPPAAPGRRATAAAIDLGLMLLVDLVVLHFTLALCGLTLNDVHILPVMPMTAFLLVLNGGYVVLFTGTLGQTLGKMAAAIEVVSDRRGGMDLRRATLRGAAMVVSLLPAGLGWIAGLMGDGRGLHDRLAGTRVIRVTGA